jgi:aminopeptidase
VSYEFFRTSLSGAFAGHRENETTGHPSATTSMYVPKDAGIRRVALNRSTWGLISTPNRVIPAKGRFMYTPSQTVLEKYARVMIDCALNSGKGIKKGDTVYIVTQVPGIPLAKAVYAQVLRSGGYPLINIIEDEFKLLQVENASNQQLGYFPEKFYRGLADSVDHWIRILADRDPLYLKKSDPLKIILANQSIKPFQDWLDAKEDMGKFTWTICLYGTEGNAKEAGMSPQAYWNQIKKACFLNAADPVAKWNSVMTKMRGILGRVNALPIEKLHLVAQETDLWITMGEKRKWLGGSGRNIPSFEIFTSPDWRGTEGEAFFDLPLYRYGNIIKDIKLSFKHGKIVSARAGKNQSLLQEIIKQKNADKIGEFSLTDKRFSHITQIMADTLYDENFGGRHGNTHLAVGRSYHDAYDGDASKMTEDKYEQLGFNSSVEHTDIIASTSRTVMAILRDGTEKIIYKNGQWTV